MVLRDIVGEPWTAKESANRLINGRISVLDARGSPPHHTVQHPGFGVYLELCTWNQWRLAPTANR